MPEPWIFKPIQPTVKAKNRHKVYTCCVCGIEDLPSNAVYFTGLLMDSTRDDTMFACKKHLGY